MDVLVKELLGHTVEVRSISASSPYTDVGVLEGCDAYWLKLRKESGELLYFPVAHVRLVKPLS